MHNPKINEAAKILGIRRYSVEKYITLGLLDQVYEAKPKRVTAESVQRLQKQIQRDNTCKGKSLPCIPQAFFKPVMLVDFRMGFYRYNKNPERLLTNGRYAVTQDGIVFNIISGAQMTDCPVDHNYRQVGLTGIGGHKVFILLHRLVALAWCPNSRFAAQVHHIDCDRTNNNCSNLIWLTHDEHVRAHQLYKEADATNNWKQYNSFIRKIRKENAWTKQQLERGIFWVPGEYHNDNYLDIYYVDFDTFQRMQTEKKTIEEVENPMIYWQYVNSSPQNCVEQEPTEETE